MSTPVTEAEEQEILHLLRNGTTALQAGRLVGRSAWIVGRIQQAHGIQPGPVGRRSVSSAKKTGFTLVDEPEEDGIGLADPWIPRRDHDLHAEKPHLRQWSAMVRAASPAERDRLRSAMCTVLGLAPICSDDSMVRALIADRRGAEELAGRYMAARASQRGPS